MLQAVSQRMFLAAFHFSTLHMPLAAYDFELQNIQCNHKYLSC